MLYCLNMHCLSIGYTNACEPIACFTNKLRADTFALLVSLSSHQQPKTGIATLGTSAFLEMEGYCELMFGAKAFAGVEDCMLHTWAQSLVWAWLCQLPASAPPRWRSCAMPGGDWLSWHSPWDPYHTAQSHLVVITWCKIIMSWTLDSLNCV